MKLRSGLRRALAGGLLLLATPLAAQDAAGGQTAQSSAGQVGQRQTREATAPLVRAPLDRIDTRLRTRVQSRIRNRIDRGYVAGASGTSAFDAAAAEQAAPPRGQ